jgi:hypothetical protein
MPVERPKQQLQLELDFMMAALGQLRLGACIPRDAKASHNLACVQTVGTTDSSDFIRPSPALCPAAEIVTKETQKRTWI